MGLRGSNQLSSPLEGLIQTFIASKETDSMNTAREYLRDIRDFFLERLGKEISELTIDDLNFGNADIEAYKVELIKRYSGSTINRKLAAIRSLFQFFKRNELPVDLEAFRVKRAKQQTRSYGVLSPEEGMRMIELAKALPNGAEKSALIAVAMATSFRLSALLDLEWGNLKRNEQGIWTLTAIDKGQEETHTMPVDDSVYLQLMQLKPGKSKIFSLSKNTCERAVKQLAGIMGIPEQRNITFHSICKIGINYAIDTEHNLKMAQAQGRHKDPITTVRHYIGSQKDAPGQRDNADMPGILMWQTPDFSVLQDMSKEELLVLIEKAGLDVQLSLIRKARE